LELSVGRLDADNRRVVFRTLKRRKRVFRAVPISATLMKELLTLASECQADDRLWPWCRQTAWRHVKKVMEAAGIAGVRAAPRGLRHQFGVQALHANVPLASTQRLLGHASPNTTVIYQHAAGDDERRFVGRLWRAYGEA
jgi:site-specific recombinase XerD